MSRYTDANCKLCRREGQKLFLKGERCYSTKCALEKRNYAPGPVSYTHLGYSHPVELKDPEGITTECTSATEVTVKGINKAVVGNYAANIRAWRRPEPYKGKGIKYADEVIRRKEGKAGAK